jgi:FkbM family methyltransferase
VTIFDYYLKIIAESEMPTVLEIGAGDGADTQRYVAAILKLMRRYRYIAFEPEPKNHEKIDSIPLHNAFEFIGAAVGDRNGRSPWRSSGAYALSGSVKEPRKHLEMWPEVKFDPPSTVPMVRLDDITAQRAIGTIDFIWCDVQGSEDLVIAGAQDTLRRTRFFYTEYYDVEVYSGQIGKREIMARLPGWWKMIRDFGSDALFQNFEL